MRVSFIKIIHTCLEIVKNAVKVVKLRQDKKLMKNKNSNTKNYLRIFQFSTSFQIIYHCLQINPSIF